MSTPADPPPDPRTVRPRARRKLRCERIRRSISPSMEPVERLQRIGWDVDADTGCWLWRGMIAGDRGRPVMTTRAGRALAHYVAYEAVYGDLPPKVFVAHTCGNGSCVNPDHLVPTLDSGRTGRPPTLSPYDRALIQERYKNGSISQTDLAAEYHVSQTTIGRIVRNG